VQIIPIVDTDSQTLNVQLAEQSVKLNLYQTAGQGFYCDVYVNDAIIIGGVLCEDRNKIVRDTYRGFVGDLMFVDEQGTSDPSSPGLGTRYLLYYLEASDL